jgi:hypothetical protein
MTTAAKPKKTLEGARTQRTTGSSAAEATTSAQLAQAVANDPEATPELRAIAAHYARELNAPPTQENAGRREQLMARWLAVVAENGG